MKPKYRDPETLSNSDEEFHPHIDTKSYRKFIKETRAMRYEELKSRDALTEEEQAELDELEYKFLPVDKDVSEGTFRTSTGVVGDSKDDLADDVIMILRNNTVEYFLEYTQYKVMDLEGFEDIVYDNLAQAIKAGDDEWGLSLCKIGLMATWARDFGRGYLMKFVGCEDKVDAIVKEHFKRSQSVILSGVGLDEAN